MSILSRDWKSKGLWFRPRRSHLFIGPDHPLGETAGQSATNQPSQHRWPVITFRMLHPHHIKWPSPVIPWRLLARGSACALLSPSWKFFFSNFWRFWNLWDDKNNTYGSQNFCIDRDSPSSYSINPSETIYSDLFWWQKKKDEHKSKSSFIYIYIYSRLHHLVFTVPD